MDSRNQISALRELIHRTFPDTRYEGQVALDDGELNELDDGHDLYEELNGRKWTELPASFLHAHPDGYVLLTDQAFRAFVAAWLIAALENTSQENLVRNFLSYAFSNNSRQYRILDRTQRETVRLLVNELAQSERSDFVRQHALEAIKLLAKVENDIEPRD